MSFLSRLAVLFVGVPLLELLILIGMGQWVGVWPTVGLVVVTGLVGAALARLEGLKTLWKVQWELGRGRLPGQALFDGFAILTGGALLLTPGILTDLVGFSLLVPLTRRFLIRKIRRRLEEQLKSGSLRVTGISTFPGENRAGWVQWSRGHGDGSSPERPEPFPLPNGEIVVEPKESDLD